MLLALDASTKATGYAIFDGKDNLVESGVLKASSPDLIKRIQKMIFKIEFLLNKYPIEKIIAEEVSPTTTPTGNINILKALLYLQGALMMLLHERYPDIETEFIMPNSWRSKLGIHTGRGIKRQSLKEADIEYTKKNFKLEVESDDEADAICLGASYFKNEKEQSAWGTHPK